MKIIHTADIHLGSKMEAKLPKEKSDERKAEVRAAFNRMLEYAKTQGVRVILLSGDIFDSDRPLKRDKDFFYSAVKNNPNIDFLYLRGNHDSVSYTEEGIKNLKTFTGEWGKYSYGDVEIYGMEMAAENALSLYSTLKTDETKKNIVMLHGQISESAGKDKINVAKLRDKNIDYLALGHVHSFAEAKLDERGRYAYSGCLEGRGFDETGEKGFVLLETDSGIQSKFIPQSIRKIEEVFVDVTGAEDVYQAYRIVKANIKCDKRDLVRVQLIGEIAFDNETLSREIEEYLNGEYYFVSVKDKTLRKFNWQELAGDVSLRGEFIRTVLSDLELSNERKQEIISVGLKALSGREVD